MGALTTDGANKLLSDVLGGTGSWGSTLYVALSTTDPTSSVTEPSGGAYARVAVPNDATRFPTASSRQISNATAITFPTATGDWGVLPYVAVFDAASGGTLLFHDALPAAVTVVSGDTVTIPVGGLVVTA